MKSQQSESLYRAMAIFRDGAGEYTVGLGGLRHVREWAEEDITKADGYVAAWIEKATWSRDGDYTPAVAKTGAQTLPSGRERS